MPFQSSIVVKSQSAGPPGPIGVSGIIPLTNSFTLPINAGDVAVTPAANSVDSLLDGQFYYGLLPGNIVVKISRAGAQYSLKSLFKLSDPVIFPANTSLYVSGDLSILAIAADVTIAVSGPTVIQIEPNPLAVGANLLATAGPIAGTITRDATNTSFSPTFALSAPVPLSAFVHAVVLGSEKSQNPLNVGSKTIEEKNGVFVFNGALSLFDFLKIFPVNWKWAFAVLDKYKKMGFGVSRLGETFIAQLNLGNRFGFKIATSYKYLIAFVNTSKEVFTGITNDGIFYAWKAEINTIKSAKVSRSKYFAFTDVQGNVAGRFESDGRLVVRSLQADVVNIKSLGGLYAPVRNILYGFPGRGQSNMTGYQSFQILNEYQSNLAYKLVDGNPSGQFLNTSADLISIAPLKEPLRTISQPNQNYPGNIFGETPFSTIAAILSSKFLGPEFASVWDSAAVSGQRYEFIKKGATGPNATNSYTSALYVVQKMKEAADKMGRRLVIRFVPFIHGETDAEIFNANYQANILEEWTNVNTDYRAITGQPETLTLLIDQETMMPWNAFPVGGPLAQLGAHKEYTGRVVLIDPSHHYHHHDVAHLDSWSTRRRGTKWAQAIAQLMAGKGWEPLRPISAIKSAGKVTVKFKVPFGPLQLNRHIVQPANVNVNGSYIANPWIPGRGFELYANSNGTSPIAITGIAIISSDTVEVYYSSGTPVLIAYACVTPYDNTNQINAGPEYSRRGALIDSDWFVGLDYQLVECTVTTGSTTITSSSGFKTVGWYDRVYGSGLPDDAIVKNRVSDSELTLSDPWTGGSGTIYLAFHSDQRNACVIFSEAI
jgi:hypothetical protein